MVNFLKHFILFVLKRNVDYQGWNLKTACQKSDKGRPWSDCFFTEEAVWLGSALSVKTIFVAN